MELYKVLDKNRMPNNGGIGQWYPGKWMPPVKGDIMPCQNGYHLCRRKYLVLWLGPEIWVAKGRGDMVEAANKVVFREARLVKRLDTWNERTARLFAADCAEHILHIYEKNNKNKAPAHAIKTARDYANGLITLDDLMAAGAAAWDAAWAAARAAAWDAARAAAWAAARGAAWAAAGDAEHQWQTDRLFQYLNGEVT